MNLEAYNAARKDSSGAGVGPHTRSWLRVTGRDRHTFLNGQISNDVLTLQPGHGVHACLLNNTGHMVADLYVHAMPDELWIEVNPATAETVVKTLSRFIIREKVEFSDSFDAHATLSIQGHGARTILSAILDEALADSALLPLSNTQATALGSIPVTVIQHAHTPSSSGFDLLMPPGDLQTIQDALLAQPGTAHLDAETFDLLRIEAGIPRWGAELDERIIPLEANLFSAINQNKGCYLGQEIIARILSKGHTNRSLVGFRLSEKTEPGAVLRGEEDDESHRSPEIGRITSVAESPEVGLIALGYVRNAFGDLGAKVYGDGFEAIVAALPFVS